MINTEDLKVRRRSWFQMAHIPEARVGWMLEDCTDVTDNDLQMVRSWIDKVKEGKIIRARGNKLCGKGLLFWGTPGQGKTTLALAVVQEIMATFSLEQLGIKENNKTLIRPCYFTTFNQILDIKGHMMGNEASADEEVIYSGMMGTCEQDSYNIRVLVIDDVGKEHASLSGWQKNVFHDILRTRFNNGLPTIVTSNVERKDWASLYGDSTESFANEIFAYIPISSTKGDLRK